MIIKEIKNDIVSIDAEEGMYLTDGDVCVLGLYTTKDDINRWKEIPKDEIIESGDYTDSDSVNYEESESEDESFIQSETFENWES